MKRLIRLAVAILILHVSISASACTTAVVSGRFTPDGRPLLLKNRDTSSFQNRVLFVHGEAYDFIGVISSGDSTGTRIWSGVNEAGFAIMNAVSYNINHGDTASVRGRDNGTVMREALGVCATLVDFEHFLTGMGTPIGVNANYGVIDAHGGAAYYETGNKGFVKFDANDPNTAPFGYIVRTNYSFAGEPDRGQGYIRYETADRLFYRAAAMNDLTPRFMLEDFVRSLSHSLTEVDLADTMPSAGEVPFFVPFRDYIPRYSTASTCLIHGVGNGEDPELSTMWTILGFSLCSVAVPAWVAGGETLPTMVDADASGNAPLCVKALQLKKRCFPVTRGNGSDYLNLSAVINAQGTGTMQLLMPLERMIFARTEEDLTRWRSEGVSKQKIANLYRWIDETVSDDFRTLYGL